MSPVFCPEAIVLRQFHPLVIREIIGTILFHIMRKARRNGEARTIRAMDLLNFFPFCAEYDAANGVFQLYTKDDHDE